MTSELTGKRAAPGRPGPGTPDEVGGVPDGVGRRSPVD